MEIDRKKVGETLEKLANSGEARGMQPELVLGCFYGLKVEDDEHCRGCGLYSWRCKDTLSSYKKEEDKK